MLTLNTSLEKLAFRFFILIGVIWISLQLWDRLTHRNVEPRVVSARGNLAMDEQATIALFRTVSPSVVSITTQQRITDYWRRNVYSVPSGSGSGFIWDDKGHLVTNYHVIKNASSATIRLNDNREYQAELIGVYPRDDLAVLRIKVEFEAPPPISLGESASVQVGQTVFAIGNPFGLDYTLTKGIISALDRSIGGENGTMIDHLIQTDAAINPGNSGGPLLDTAGRIIGITTAIYSPSGASSGVGFAIPVDTVNRVVTALIQKGRFTPPSLGIGTDDTVNQVIAKRLKIEGVVVLAVDENTIAEKVGLRASRVDKVDGFILGDIILAINDLNVSDRRQLIDVLSKLHGETQWRIKIWRNKQAIELKWNG